MSKTTDVVGERCPVSGYYVCSNCGHYEYYEEGDPFEPCLLCGEEDIEWEWEE